jgi:hypothetical protein
MLWISTGDMVSMQEQYLRQRAQVGRPNDLLAVVCQLAVPAPGQDLLQQLDPVENPHLCPAHLLTAARLASQPEILAVIKHC